MLITTYVIFHYKTCIESVTKMSINIPVWIHCISFKSQTVCVSGTGVTMKLMDEVAGIVAFRHCNTNIVTASVEAINFHRKIHKGEDDMENTLRALSHWNIKISTGWRICRLPFQNMYCSKWCCFSLTFASRPLMGKKKKKNTWKSGNTQQSIN